MADVSAKSWVVGHGVEDVAAAAGEADEGGVVLLALGPFAVVVGAAGGCDKAANAARKNARLSCLLPPVGGCSPLIEVPERRVTGAMPA